MVLLLLYHHCTMNQVAVFNEISIDIESDCSSIQFLVARTSLALSLSLVDQFNHTMGKGKKHNKLYITQSEWINEFGGKRLDGNEFEGKGHKALPFHCCALSLTPFETPVCTPDGIIYEITCVSCRLECCISSRDHRWLTHTRSLSLACRNIIPYLRKHKVDPISGQAMSFKSLLRLHFHKNAEGQYHDPMTHKLFNEHTHIVAIRTSGQVYAMATVQGLCPTCVCVDAIRAHSSSPSMLHRTQHQIQPMDGLDDRRAIHTS